MRRISQKKTGRDAVMMGSTLTDPEVDAALQLIQLSGDSGDSSTKTVGTNDKEEVEEEEEEESFGNNTVVSVHGGGGITNVDDQISSTMNNDDVIADNLDLDDEAFPLRKRKFRSISDLYLKTKPLLKRRGKKGRKN